MWRVLEGLLSQFCEDQYKWLTEQLQEMSLRDDPYQWLQLAGMIDPQKVMPVMEREMLEIQTMNWFQLEIHLMELNTERKNEIVLLMLKFMSNPLQYLECPSE
jgi:hypothetical protein